MNFDDLKRYHTMGETELDEHFRLATEALFTPTYPTPTPTAARYRMMTGEDLNAHRDEMLDIVLRRPVVTYEGGFLLSAEDRANAARIIEYRNLCREKGWPCIDLSIEGWSAKGQFSQHYYDPTLEDFSMSTSDVCETCGPNCSIASYDLTEALDMAENILDFSPDNQAEVSIPRAALIELVEAGIHAEHIMDEFPENQIRGDEDISDAAVRCGEELASTDARRHAWKVAFLFLFGAVAGFFTALFL